MKKLLVLLSIILVLTGCHTVKQRHTTHSFNTASMSVSNSSNNLLTILEQSTRFHVYSQIHTNSSLVGNYQNAVSMLDNALTNEDSTAITVRNQFEQQEPVVYENLTQQFKILTWYSTNKVNFSNGFTAFKKGIVDVIHN